MQKSSKSVVGGVTNRDFGGSRLKGPPSSNMDPFPYFLTHARIVGSPTASLILGANAPKLTAVHPRRRGRSKES
eukprot:scaffold502_cov350-Pavlova_lutheri.AAC.11